MLLEDEGVKPAMAMGIAPRRPTTDFTIENEGILVAKQRSVVCN
jgi:hypothetical protein